MAGDDMRAPMGPSIQRVDGIQITLSVSEGRQLIRWLGAGAEYTRQRYGCAPLGLIKFQHAVAEEVAAHSRRRDSEDISAAAALALGDEPVVSVEEAARMLRLKSDTVRLMCREGTLVAKKEAGRWFPTASAVHAELRQRAERSF